MLMFHFMIEGTSFLVEFMNKEINFSVTTNCHPVNNVNMKIDI